MASISVTSMANEKSRSAVRQRVVLAATIGNTLESFEWGEYLNCCGLHQSTASSSSVYLALLPSIFPKCFRCAIGPPARAFVGCSPHLRRRRTCCDRSHRQRFWLGACRRGNRDGHLSRWPQRQLVRSGDQRRIASGVRRCSRK